MDSILLMDIETLRHFRPLWQSESGPESRSNGLELMSAYRGKTNYPDLATQMRGELPAKGDMMGSLI